MACKNADVPAISLSQTDAEAAVLCLINEERAALNLPPLTLNLILQKVAREQAMAAATIKWWPDSGDAGHIPHENPITGDEQVRIKQAGYCPSNPDVARNENAYSAWGHGDPSGWADLTSPASAVKWWINSPDHFATLSDPRYRETGVGVVRGTASMGLPADADGSIFVQTFGACEKVTPAVNTELWAFGGNGHGQLGDAGVSANANAPVHPRDFESFIAVAASHHSVAVKSDGTVWTWGPRENKGTVSGGSNVPVKVADFDQVTTVAAGYEHNLAIRNDGTVWAWGDNRWAQLGDGSGTDQEKPVQVRGLTGVTAVAAGRGHSLALRSDGSVWAWGGNYHGQLGIGSFVDQRFPVRVPLSRRSSAIAAGDDHTIIIEEGTGQLWLCGWNIAGCLGIGDPSILDVMVPTKPAPNGNFTGADIVAAAGGFDNSYAVDKSGRVWAWGDNVFSQLGSGTSSIPRDPTARHVRGLSDIVGLSAGSFHCLALNRDGTLWSWGSNSAGQLGQGLTAGPDQPPRRVVALDHTSAFSAGYVHSLAIARGAK
jgi:uncharacterized protein YkwD